MGETPDRISDGIFTSYEKLHLISVSLSKVFKIHVVGNFGGNVCPGAREDRLDDGAAVVTHVGSALPPSPPSARTTPRATGSKQATFRPSLPPSLPPTCETDRASERPTIIESLSRRRCCRWKGRVKLVKVGIAAAGGRQDRLTNNSSIARDARTDQRHFLIRCRARSATRSKILTWLRNYRSRNQPAGRGRTRAAGGGSRGRFHRHDSRCHRRRRRLEGEKVRSECECERWGRRKKSGGG